MPTVKVSTSKPMERAQQEALCLELSSAVATILGKPESYVQVIVSDDAPNTATRSFPTSKTRCAFAAVAATIDA